MKSVRLGALLLATAVLALAGCTPQAPTSPQGSASTSGQAATASTIPASATVTQSTTSTPAAKKSEEPAAAATESGKNFGYVKKVFAKNGDVYITIDYALFLTGKAATDAAKAHGSTVENDYFVVNDNPKLRTFRLGSSAKIGYQLSGGSPDLTTISPAAFLAKWTTPGDTAVRQNGYWIWLDKSVVTKMSEQFIP